METLERQIKEYLRENNMKQADVYKKLGISKQNFYRAIRSKNFDNPTLQKILNFLDLEIFISLQRKNENTGKDQLSSTGKP